MTGGPTADEVAAACDRADEAMAAGHAAVTERNRLLRAYAAAHPDMGGRQIAEAIGKPQREQMVRGAIGPRRSKRRSGPRDR